MPSTRSVLCFPRALLAASLLAALSFAGNFSEAQCAQQTAPTRQPTAAEMSKKETVASALLRGLHYQEYELRSAAEAMPEEKYGYRPAEGNFKNEQPQFSPAEVRSFAAIRKSLGAIDAKTMFGPIEGPYAGPNTRLGLATVVIWHAADHYGQLTLYLRESGIVPPASRPNPPELHEQY